MILFRRTREVEDQLTSVKIINQRLKTCKQHLQCVSIRSEDH